MIVYGDPQFDCAYLAIIDALSERVAQTNSDDLDDLRPPVADVGVPEGRGGIEVAAPVGVPHPHILAALEDQLARPDGAHVGERVPEA